MKRASTNGARLTVIVPAYNEEKNIKNVLMDLLKQDFNQENIKLEEIVVVSSGSNDRTDYIVEQMARKYDKIRLIREEKRRGKGSAINLAMNSIKSDIVAIVSADVRVPRNSLKHLVKPLLEDSTVGMTTGSALIYPTADEKIKFINNFMWMLLNETNNYLSSRGALAHCLGELYAFRRALFTKIPRDVINEDQYLAIAIKKKRYKVIYVEKAKVIFRAPSTLHEIKLQRARVNYGHRIMIKKYKTRPSIFSQLLLSEPAAALKIFTRVMRLFPPRTWLYIPLLLFIELSSHLQGILTPRRFSPTWETITTTKYEIKGETKQ